MLHGNYHQNHKIPCQFVGGGNTVNELIGLRANWNKNGATKNRYYGECWVGVADNYGLPAGYQAPYAYNLPIKGGGMGSNVGIQSTSEFTGVLAAGKNLESTIACSGDITAAQLDLVVSMVAAISASGAITDAGLKASVNLVANLAASGDLVGSLTALGNLVSTITAQASLSPEMNATANMEADITPFIELSPENLAAAVWNAAAAAFNTSGTMGEKLNGAGSAGDPWTTDLDAYNTEGTAGKLLKDKLAQSKFIALK